MKFQDHPSYNNPEIRDLLFGLIKGAKNKLGDIFFGAWLQGSSATGHFDQYSDIDFLIGIERDLSDIEIDSLEELHRTLYEFDSPFAKHLEGSYIPRDVLSDYNRAGEEVWYLDHGSTTFERSAHDNTIAVKWILREKGVVLEGPDPSSFMNPIPVNELRKDIFQTFSEWAELIFDDHTIIGNHFYQTFAVLSYCRMVNDIRCGDIGSKRDGAEWAKENLDSKWHNLIDRAWLGRPNPSRSVKRAADPEDLLQTVEFIRTCLKEASSYMNAHGLDPKSL